MNLHPQLADSSRASRFKPSQAPLHGQNGEQCSNNVIPTKTSHSEHLSAAGLTSPPLRPGRHSSILAPTETTYVKHNNLWHLYSPTTRSRTSVSFITTTPDPPPTDMLPIITTDPTPKNHRHQLRIYTYSKREDTIIFQQSPVTSFPQFFRTLPTHERWIVGHVQCTSSISHRHEQFSRSHTHRRLRTRLRWLSQRTIHYYLLQSNSIPLYTTHIYHQPL